MSFADGANDHQTFTAHLMPARIKVLKPMNEFLNGKRNPFIM